jgi:hypothetical protein
VVQITNLLQQIEGAKSRRTPINGQVYINPC